MPVAVGNALALQLRVDGSPAAAAALDRVERAADEAAAAARDLGRAGGAAGDGMDDAGRSAARAAPQVAEAGDASDSASDGFAGLGEAAAALAGPLALATAGAVAFIGVWEAAKAGAKLTTAERELDRVGVSLDRLRDSAGGLAETADLVEFGGALGRAGFGKFADTAVQAAVALNSSGVEMKQALDKIKAAFIESKPEQLVEEFGLSIEKTGDAATDFRNTLAALEQFIADSGGVQANALRFYTAWEDKLKRLSEGAWKLADAMIRIGSYRPEGAADRLAADELEAAEAIARIEKRLTKLRADLALGDAAIAARSGFTRTGEQVRAELAEQEELLRQENSKRADLRRQLDGEQQAESARQAKAQEALQQAQTAAARLQLRTKLDDLRASQDEEYAIRLKFQREREALDALGVGSDVAAMRQRGEALAILARQEREALEAARARRDVPAPGPGLLPGEFDAAAPVTGEGVDTTALDARYAFIVALEAEQQASRLAMMEDGQRQIEQLRIDHLARLAQIDREAAEAGLEEDEAHKARRLQAEQDYQRERAALLESGAAQLTAGQEALNAGLIELQEQLARYGIATMADMFSGIIAGQEQSLPVILAAFVDTFGQLLIQLGTTAVLADAVFLALSTFAPGAAIAAGIAAIAAGSAMRGVAGQIRKGASGGGGAAVGNPAGAGPNGFGPTLQAPNQQEPRTVIIQVDGRGSLDTSDSIAEKVMLAIRRGNELGMRMA